MRNRLIAGTLILLTAFSLILPVYAAPSEGEGEDAVSSNDVVYDGVSIDDARISDFYSKYNCTYYGLDDGLSSIEINAITQTEDGFIWIGSYAGLYRYNGSSFSDINLDERIANVTALETDSKGRLWIGTNDNGIACYDTASGMLDFYDVSTGLPSNTIRCITAVDNNIYVGTATNLVCIDEEGNINVYNADRNINCVTCLDAEKDGTLVGVTISGTLFTMKNGVVKELSKFTKVSNVDYTNCLVMPNGDILLGTTGTGLYYCHKDAIDVVSEYVTDSEETMYYINDMYYDATNDGYFICSNNGMAYVNKDKEAENISTNEFSGSVTDALVDYQGNVWFSSDKHGVCKYSYNPFTDVFKMAGESEHAVNAVLNYRGYTFIGTDDGLVVLDGKTSQKVSINGLEMFDGTRIRHLYRDSKDNLWLCTYSTNGLVCIESDGKVKKYTEAEGTLGSRFRSVIELQDGTILAATSSGLSYIKDGKVIGTMGEEDGLEMPQILSLIQTSDGTVYAGSDGAGVFVIKGGLITDVYNEDDGLDTLVILRIVECEQGQIYVTSNALYFNDGKKIRKLKNFPYSNNYDVVLANDDKAWVLSSAGIYIVELDDMLSDKEEYKYVLLDKFDGFDTTLTANAWRCFDQEGYLYLCCSDTVKKVRIDEVDKENTDYNLAIGSVMFDDQLVIGDFSKGIEIPPATNRVVINLAVLNFSLSNPLVKVYLEGFDEQGITTYQNGLSEISFTNIPNGKYTLHMDIINEFTGEVEKELIVPITKEKQFFEHSFFKIYLYCVIFFVIFCVAWLFAKFGSINKIKEQYAEIQKAKEEAEEANKAKSRFLAKMTHEIRTPINAILGMNELLMRENISPNVYGYAQEIQNSGNSLLSIINDILDSSKIEAGKMNIVPVEYEVREFITAVYSVLEVNGGAKGLETKLVVDPMLPKMLYGDMGKLKQVTLNLISNAVKYTESGSVTLVVKKVSEFRRETTIRVEVIDTGIGIKAEDMDKLFTTFERLDERRNTGIQGTGLGLNITKELLALMDSQIEVESVYGKGSTFAYSIKQSIVDKAEMGEFSFEKDDNKPAKKFVPSITAKNAKILIVDDSRVNLKVAKGLLTAIEASIDTCTSGAECIKLAVENKYDLIFLDSMMPEMDGTETLHKLKKTEGYDTNTPVVALTANVFEGAREHYISEGFADYITKPVSGKDLEDIVIKYVSEDKIVKNKNKDNEDRKASDKRKENAGMLVDKSVGMELCDGDEELYAEIIEAYLEDSEETIANIKKTYDAEDWKNYTVYVHGLKSASRNVGAVTVSEKAYALEMAGKSDDIDFIKANNDDLIETFGATIKEMKG